MIQNGAQTYQRFKATQNLEKTSLKCKQMPKIKEKEAKFRSQPQNKNLQ